MKKRLIGIICAMVMIALVAAPALAKSPLLLKHEAEMAAHDAKMAALKAQTAIAASEADKARAKQNTVMKVVTLIPGPGWIFGHLAAACKAGEMSYCEEYIRAVRNGTAKPAGNETCRGLAYLFFKGLSTAPEGMAFYGVGRTLGLVEFDQMDYYSVFTSWGRPLWLDATVIGAKAAFGVMGAYALDTGLPALGGHWMYKEPVNLAFLWMAAGGGGWNVVSGTASQAFQGAKPFNQYYDLHRWWSGREPLK